ncbi:MAG: GNAT family N-acetyltransferase [Cyanobacteria bacterium SBLK]|nr:GNAT family N-acetyltransferase [Cyanobacteria bacterium SBLK]
MTLTYQELFPEQESFSHLARTVDRYFSPETLLFWVISVTTSTSPSASSHHFDFAQCKQPPLRLRSVQAVTSSKVACLWMGNGIDQVSGDRYSYIFLVYVRPEHRRQGIGSALMQYAHTLARERGDRQIGLHVFSRNRPAVNLYERLGYEPQSLLMVKKLIEPNS